MQKKPLTNKSGQVRELTSKDIRDMKPAGDILPAALMDVLLNRKRIKKHPHHRPKHTV